MSQGFTRPEGPTGATGADGAGVPTGGATGEVLEKIDATDHNTQWAEPTDADAIHDNVGGEIAAITEKASPVSADLILIEDSAAANAKKRVQVGNLPGGSSSPLTTKGDLYGYDTADARIPIGTDDFVLTADAAQALGVKWAAAGAGGGQTVPVWMEHLADRTAGSETVHSDDQEFTGTIGGTAYVEGTATWTQSRGLLSVAYEDQGSSAPAARLYALTPGSYPVTVETRVRAFGTGDGSQLVGILLTDGVISTSTAAWFRINGDGSSYGLYSGTLASCGAIGTSDGISFYSVVNGLYLRLIWTAADTFEITISPDGVAWSKLAWVAVVKALTPTHFGVAVSSSGASTVHMASFEYLRITESDLSL